MCFIYFLISFMPMQGQKNRKTESIQSQNTITTWDGKSWDNGIPTHTTKAVFASDYVASENIHALEIEILPQVKVTFTENVILKVTNDVRVAKTGKLIFQENAQLVQKNPNATVASAVYTRKTRKIDKFDYTYFCSPVEGQVLNQIGDNSSNQFLSYNPQPYLPPLFDKYYFFNQNATPDPFFAGIYNAGNWENVAETNTMDPVGVGYIVRGPQSFPQGNKQVWSTKFEGIAHNGTYTTPLKGASYSAYTGAIPGGQSPYRACGDTKYSPAFIGNPYPSMLDADSFLSHPSNVANLSGAIYMWTHNTGPSGIPGDATYNYTADDFVIYNLVGGIGTGRVGGEPIYAPNYSNRPNGKIAMCQGFITRGINPTGVATFTNDMRDDSQNANPDNQQFYRTTAANGTNLIPSIPKNRIWLSLEASSGAGGLYKETLIGYMPSVSVPASASTAAYTIAGSTNGYEKTYDTEVLVNWAFNATSENAFKIYTITNPTTPCPRLVIQGRKLDATFNDNDVVPLGFTCPSGTYKIKIELKDGLFDNQLIWLREQTSPGVYTYFDDIRTTGHLFSSTGDLDNTTRFQIVFRLPNLPTVTNIPIICGTTLNNIEETLFTNNVSGVNLYSFEVRRVAPFPDPTGIVVGTYPGNLPLPYQFNLNFSQIDPDTTYWVRPASYQVDGQWVYGQTCQVKTPSATSYVISPACGTVVNSRWVTIGAQPRTNFFGEAATKYRFTAFVAGNYFGEKERTVPNCQLAQLGVTTADTNKTFTIRVDIFWRNQWQIGTTFCDITTANVITRQSENGISIFEASTYPNPFENNFKLDINTSSDDQIELVVYDMLGRQMEARTIQVADLDTQEIGNNYASGVYNLIIKQADNTKTLRVIKR